MLPCIGQGGRPLESQTPTLIQLTIAAEHVLPMVHFYNHMFAADLQPIAAAGTTLYRGQLHGVTLLVCPNTLANVIAEQNRHQFTYAVADLAAVLRRAQSAGGSVLQHGPDTLTILDPDGNTIVFQQVA